MVTPEHDFDLHQGDLYLRGGCSSHAVLVNYLCTPTKQEFFLSAPKCRQSQVPAAHAQRFQQLWALMKPNSSGCTLNTANEVSGRVNTG